VTLVLDHDSDGGIEAVLEQVAAADAAADFDVDITGANTLDHDFNALSESDLRDGELKFGLPAANDRADPGLRSPGGGVPPDEHRRPLHHRDCRDLLGPRPFTSISFFIVNMITAMGLTLGIDYSLFVLSRYREERQAGPASTGRRRRRPHLGRSFGVRVEGLAASRSMRQPPWANRQA
jgi:RND superfamily putative drug exporter